MNQSDKLSLEGKITEVLRTCYDPEIPVNIYDLGLVYELAVGDEGDVKVKMTLTAPSCPVAGSLVSEVEQKLSAIEGVSHATVDLVWEPPWDPGKMSEAARLELGMM